MNDKKRLRELGSLEALLSQCERVNSSSNVIERLQEIIVRAGDLNRADYNECRPSFMEYVISLVVKDVELNQTEE